MSTPLIAAYTGSAAARLRDTGGAAMPGTAIWRAWCASMAAAISADRSTPPTAALLPAALASASQIGGPGPIIDSVLSLAAFAVAVAGEACRAEISSISPILHSCSIAALASARAASTAALASRASARASAFACSVAPRFTSRWERGMGDSAIRTADAADGAELIAVDDDLMEVAGLVEAVDLALADRLEPGLARGDDFLRPKLMTRAIAPILSWGGRAGKARGAGGEQGDEPGGLDLEVGEPSGSPRVIEWPGRKVGSADDAACGPGCSSSPVVDWPGGGISSPCPCGPRIRSTDLRTFTSRLSASASEASFEFCLSRSSSSDVSGSSLLEPAERSPEDRAKDFREDKRKDVRRSSTIRS